MNQFRLQLLQPGFRLLAFGEVADKSREEPLIAGMHFADGKLHRKGRAVLALANHNAPDADADDIVTSVMSILDNPEWADLFTPSSLAEAPIAAVVGGRVVAGTIDRLVIEADRIRLVDFKTARRPPATLGEVPAATLRQLAAYAAALGVTYPGRTVQAAVLYTATPRLIAIPEAVLAEHKQALAAAE